MHVNAIILCAHTLFMTLDIVHFSGYLFFFTHTREYEHAEHIHIYAAAPYHS